MSIAFGLCKDRFITWEVIDSSTVVFTDAEGEETLELCLDPIKGATINGEEVSIVDRILQLPEDLFGSGVVSFDGQTYTLTFPGEDPVEICLDPVKSVVDNGDNTWTATTQSGETTLIRDTFGTLVDNGDGTATVTMPNGQPKTIVCAPLPADIRVTGIETVPTSNEDGSTSYEIVLTLSDGTTLPAGPIIDRDMFGTVVPDNGDGTGTVTDSQGNELIVALNPVLLGKDGQNLPAGSRVQTYEDLDNPDRGPLQDLQCVEGSIQATYCDGSKLYFTSCTNKALLSFNPDDIDSNTANDIVLGSALTTVTFPRCGVRPRFHSYWSAKMFGNYQGRAQVHPEASLDGGATWFELGTGAIDDVQAINSTNNSFIGEVGFNDTNASTMKVSGETEIGYRLRLETNGVTAGVLGTQFSTCIVYWEEMVCCE